MRMIDKASGELGKTIAHPLQAKVDGVLFKHLGDKSSWRNGCSIAISKFDSINNKPYVTNRLKQHGFELDLEGGVYIYSSINSLELAKQEEAEPRYRLVEVRTKEQTRLDYIKVLLLEGAVVSNKHLSRSLRRAFSSAVANFKNSAGVDVHSARMKDRVQFTIYCIDKQKIQDYSEYNYADMAGIFSVASRLSKFGYVRLKDLDIEYRYLVIFISRLRAEGWEIETITKSKGGSKGCYKLISRP